MNDPIQDRMRKPGPKKILACDGGGILGLMSIEILATMEAELRNKTGRPDLVLADFFDYVCGTSTGAIISTCIAVGMSTEAMRKFYVDSGPLMFERASIFKRARYAYDDEPLARILQREINKALGYEDGDKPATLGDPRLRALLMIVMRNHTTDSPWLVNNNPAARYNARNLPDCNLDLPLWQLVRASTAAPTFFPPEVVVFAPGTPQEYSFVFVDGGVTTYNNPAFLAFQTATMAPYNINWKTGEENLLIVSVGTGNAPKARPELQAGDLWLLDHAKNIPSALMNAASAGWDMACRMLGACRFGAPIDSEFGDGVVIEGAGNWTGPKQFTYVRYDPDVTATGLKALGLDGKVRPENVQVMDSVAHVKDIQAVGMAYAQRNVKIGHLAPFA